MKDKKELIQIRISKKEKNKAQIRANLYFSGNLSKWLRYCLENANVKKLKKK